MSKASDFPAPIAEEIWNLKYRLRSADGSPLDADLDATFQRVARAAAGAEKGGRKARDRWAERFHEAIADRGFLPAGRILAGAGSKRRVTLFNCFVMGRIDDDLGAIFEQVKEAALTMQLGGGIGHDFSTLRPKGASVSSIGADASGPVSFMGVWDAMCRTIMSAGARRGAMMATLRCDHPDIEAFIDAKKEPGQLRNFNLSVLVSDAFLEAVRRDRDWDLVFGGKIHRTVSARALWDRLMRATYDYAEPGVIFIDRVNAANNLAYCEQIQATNPCGEQPLPPYGACLLGSINLAALVVRPFSAAAAIDTTRLEERVRTAVRFLDNVIEISAYPLARQREEAKAKRRIGLGVTGLADALIMLGAGYDSPRGRELAEGWMAAIQRSAYLASCELAAEKGAFALLDVERFLTAPNPRRLGAELAAAVRKHGIRNGCLTSIAPTGTISLLAGNVSSGIEPVYDFHYTRHVLDAAGNRREQRVDDFAYALFRRQHGEGALPDSFVRAVDLAPRAHLEMQSVMQRHVDSAISKTINCPEDMPFEAFADVYLEAYRMGLKGCTTYRPNPVTGAVLEPIVATVPAIAATIDSPAPALASTPPAEPPGPPRRGAQAGEVVYMARPLERDGVLSGYTYKLKWPASDHAIYVTINDIERDGRRRPFEIFINTRNLEHYAWTVALTRMISAVFRRGGDVTFVAEELKAVFDPQGGQWLAGRYVPSLLAAIGEVIEAHMVRIGFLQAGHERQAGQPDVEDDLRPRLAEPGRGGAPGGIDRGHGRTHPPPRLCPRCSSADYLRQEGCWVCRSCGFSRCG